MEIAGALCVGESEKMSCFGVNLDFLGYVVAGMDGVKRDLLSRIQFHRI